MADQTVATGAASRKTRKRSVLRLLPPRRSLTALRRVEEGESLRTIVIALLANLVIAAAKLIAGLASGSSALIAEAAHSAADCVNEVFLAVGLWRAGKPPDEAHPVGHGRERFLWALMAAITSFLVGGCLSIAIAIARLRHPGSVEGGLAAWIVLGIAFAADGASWLQGLRQARRQAKDYGLNTWRYVLRSSDPVVRAVVVEDSAALIGLLLAAAGLLLSGIYRSSVPDSIASLLIGLFLAVTAFAIAKPFADFLVGRSIPAPLFERLRAIIEEDPAIEEVISLRAMYSAPEEVIVAGKARAAPALDMAQLATAMDELDHRIRQELPFVADVFIDVTGKERPPDTPPADATPSARRPSTTRGGS
jgi:cation diffusion facilitator family transporter